MYPELPDVQTSPVGLVVENNTVPVSGGKLELDRMRSPFANVIFHPFFPIKSGSVQVLVEIELAPEFEVVVVMFVMLLAATVKFDEGLLSTTE